MLATQTMTLFEEPQAGARPALLRWARETMGYSVEEVAERVKRHPDVIEAWESGTATPTYSQLETLAYEVYKRPLATFFLPTPPDEPLPARKFRTLPDSDLNKLKPDTYLQIRRGQARQFSLKELFSDRNPSPRLIWRDLRLSVDRSVPEQAAAVRQFLQVSMEIQTAWKTDATALKGWRTAIESAGVFVFKASFKQEELSGFCLFDDEFPIIVLNNGNAQTRQAFSLLHELAHLLLGENGISKTDLAYIDQLPGGRRELERFCNALAAEVLMPADDFRQHSADLPTRAETATDRQFARLSSRYHVSREVVLRRLLDQGNVTTAFYRRKAAEWSDQKAGAGSGGGDYYATQNVYLSSRFAEEVVRRRLQQKITLEQASSYLGVKARNFAALEQRILQGAAA